MDVDGKGALKPIDAAFDLRDSRFSPAGSQEEPELSDIRFDDGTAQLFGCENMMGLSIQRVDLLQRAVGEFHRLAQSDGLESVAKAKQAMDIINSISDPELTELAPQVTSALIDGEDTPDFSFELAQSLDDERLKARDMLFSGDVERAIESAQSTLERMDASSTTACSPPKAKERCSFPTTCSTCIWSLPTCSPKSKASMPRCRI